MKTPTGELNQEVIGLKQIAECKGTYKGWYKGVFEIKSNAVELTRKVRNGAIKQKDWNLGLIAELSKDQRFWDEMTGYELDSGLVRTAREEELIEFRKHQVYTKVPIKECWDQAGKQPIGTRWIDINKGDRINPEYRSRLVAQEIKTDKREDLFAATPPLEAIKLLISMAVTEGIGYEKDKRENGMKLDFIDVRRAFFHSDA